MVLRNPYGYNGRDEAMMEAYLRNGSPDRFAGSRINALMGNQASNLAATTGAQSSLYDQSPGAHSNRMDLALTQAPIQTQMYRDYVGGRGPVAGDMRGLQGLMLASHGQDPLMASSPQERLGMERSRMNMQVEQEQKASETAFRKELGVSLAQRGDIRGAWAMFSGKDASSLANLTPYVPDQYMAAIAQTQSLDQLEDVASQMGNLPDEVKMGAFAAILQRAKMIEPRESPSMWSWIGGVGLLLGGTALAIATAPSIVGVGVGAGIGLAGAGILAKNIRDVTKGERGTFSDMRQQLEAMKAQRQAQR